MEFKTAEEIRKTTEDVLSKKNIDELMQEYIIQIKERIELNSSNGEFETIINVKENCKDELCKRLKSILVEKNYNVRINKYPDSNIIKINWRYADASKQEYADPIDKIKEELLPTSFNAFFKPLQISIENDKLQVIAPNDFTKGIIESRYIGLLQDAYDIDEIIVSVGDEDESN